MSFHPSFSTTLIGTNKMRSSRPNAVPFKPRRNPLELVQINLTNTTNRDPNSNHMHYQRHRPPPRKLKQIRAKQKNGSSRYPFSTNHRHIDSSSLNESADLKVINDKIKVLRKRIKDKHRTKYINENIINYGHGVHSVNKPTIHSLSDPLSLIHKTPRQKVHLLPTPSFVGELDTNPHSNNPIQSTHTNEPFFNFDQNALGIDTRSDPKSETHSLESISCNIPRPRSSSNSARSARSNFRRSHSLPKSNRMRTTNKLSKSTKLLVTTSIPFYDSNTKTVRRQIPSLQTSASSIVSHSHSTAPCSTLQTLATSTKKMSFSVKGSTSESNAHDTYYNFHFWKQHPKSPLAIRHYEPLMYAVEHDDLDGAKRLIGLIVDESSSKTLKWLSSLKDHNGNTLAHCAAMSRRKNYAQSMLGLLCKFRVHLNGINKDGITPLDIVAMHGDVEWIREIIAMGGSSQIHPQQLIDMKDHDVTRWLVDYQKAVRANGYTQTGPAIDPLDGKRRHDSHHRLQRKPKAKKPNTRKFTVKSRSGHGTDVTKKPKQPDRKRNILRIASLSTVAVVESADTIPSVSANVPEESKENVIEEEAPSTTNNVSDPLSTNNAPKQMDSAPKTNVFAVMNRVNRFKNKLKDKVEDAHHAQSISKEAPIQRPNVKRLMKKKKKNNNNQRPKDWSIQRLRREVYRLKGKLPHFQKYGKYNRLIDYTDIDHLHCSSIETVRENLKRKHSGFTLNVLSAADILKLAEVFGEIDANGNGTVFVTELAAYYQLLTVSNGLYNASHAMDDVKVLLQIMELDPDKDGMALNLWLNLWNLISINFGPLFVDEMLNEYAVFKMHVQGLNPDQKSEKMKNQIKRAKSAKADGKSEGANVVSIEGIQKSELCMLFDV